MCWPLSSTVFSLDPAGAAAQGAGRFVDGDGMAGAGQFHGRRTAAQPAPMTA
jgi:hypothetical protein